MVARLTIARNQKHKLVYCSITGGHQCMRIAVNTLRTMHKRMDYSKTFDKFSISPDDLKDAIGNIFADKEGNYPGWDFMIINHKNVRVARRDRHQILTEHRSEDWIVLNHGYNHKA